MKTVTSLFLVALLVASAFAECVNRSPLETFVGDYDALDTLVSCSGQQSLALPSAQLGGHGALTFEVEVFPRDFAKGCVFSYGNLALRFAVDPNNQLGQVHFHIGNQVASTGGVVTKNVWHTIAVVVKNNENGNGAIATISVDGFAYDPQPVASLPTDARSGHLGYCSVQKSFFDGAVDNFIITAKAKTAVELKDNQALIFPFVAQNDLVQLWTFNDDGATTHAFTGEAGQNVAFTHVTGAEAGSAPCVREAKAQTKYAGARITNKFCQHSGSVVVAAGSTADAISNVSPFQSQEGGLSQTFACKGGEEFTFNQKWSNGGIIEVTIKTSMHHRWRVSANPGDALQVDHQNWGGWTKLSTGSGIVHEDRSAYSINDDTFVIQAPGIGWIAVTQNGGFLNYQYALSTAACAAATCDYLTVEEFQYNFQNPPLPEPMGNQETTNGIQNLPPVLACPNPALNGYNPFMYCWGWLVGPKVNYVRDWNGNVWQMSDPGCCRNPAIYAGNQWSFQRWGHMVAGMTLPWCTEMQVPPLDPPKPQTGVPTYPTDPCEGVSSQLITKFKQVCTGLWGSNQADGRFIGCVAQLCITEDPTTVPPPDCRTERLLATLDNTHVVPPTCNECPGNCNFRGTCSGAPNLQCSCQAGWTGPDCGQPTEYPCWSFAGDSNNKLLPFQLKTLDPKFPEAPVLTQTMTDPIYTQFAHPGNKRAMAIADTLVFYLTQTVEDFNSNNIRYHLWAYSNNAAGFVDVDYTLTITSTNSNWNADPEPLRRSQLDMFGPTTEPASGTIGGPGPFYPQLDRALSGNTFTVRIKHSGSQYAGIVVRNLPSNYAGSITVASNNGGQVPYQILVAGASSSAAAKFDVTRVSKAAALAGFAIGGTTCANDPVCPTLGCAQCTQNPACGWCVETSQCIKGDVTGPAFGECFNWRKTFDAGVSRRVTQIPSYPVNPGLTEIYLRSAASGSDLPVSLAITPKPYDKSEWDVAVFTDFATAELSTDKWVGQIQGFTSRASGFPNLGLSITSLEPRENLIPTANTRNDEFETCLRNFRRVPPASGLAAVGDSLATLADNVGQLRLRTGTRKVALFKVGRGHDGLSALTDDVIDKLMKKQIMPVFCVPYSQFNAYKAMVAHLGFGHVIPLTPDYAQNLENALAIAGSSIGVTVLRSDRTTTHVDWAAFTGKLEHFNVHNLPSGFRAKFSVPMVRNAALSDVQSTDLIVPGYGSANVENIPTARAEFPWTTTGGKISMLDNNGAYLIELNGMSFRGLMAVTPKVTGVTTLPGQLYRAVRVVQDGEVRYTAGDLINSFPQTVADGRVIFLPAVGTTGTGSISYTVFDKCIESAVGTIEVEVTASNKAPFADMPNLVTRQFTPLELTLGYGDDKKDTTGQYQFRMVHTVNSQRDGALYRFYAGFDPAAPNAAFLIADNDVFTDPHLIYMPPQYKYSDAIRPALLTLPCFVYKVEETNEAPNLISNEKEVIITVTHVNVAPYHWQQQNPAWPTLGNEPWPVGETWPNVDSSVCWDTCTFLQDMGAQSYWEARPAQIFLGGNDIEGDLLSYEISSLDCNPAAILLGPFENDPSKGKLKVGDVLARKEQPGSLLPLIRFLPAPETSGNDYCKIGYRVRDANEALSPERIITIHITQTNKQPRLSDGDTTLTVNAVEQKKTAFAFTAVDPENDPFSLGFMGCTSNRGLIEFCTNSACEAFVTIDCAANVYPLAAPIALTDIATNEYVNGVLQPITGFFTSEDIEEVRFDKYNSIHFILDDGVSTFEPSNADVIFNVVVINTAPILFVSEENIDTYELTLLPGEGILLPLRAFDAEVSLDESYHMTVRLALDNTDAPNAKFDLAALQASGCSDVTQTLEETFLEYTCTQDATNTFLGSINVIAPANGPQVLEGSVNIKLELSDNGVYGQCDVNHINNDACILTDKVEMVFHWTALPNNNNVAVASGAAAAGVAGAAAVAAVALFRRLNKKAEESYQPWDSNENDDATAVNPLYQESGSKGENPLFEAKSDL
jgi:hypothetical protein